MASEEDNWRQYIAVAYDDFLPLKEIIEQFGLTHIKGEDGELSPIAGCREIKCNEDQEHLIGYLRKNPFGTEWAAYIVTYFVEGENGEPVAVHRYFAKKRKKRK